MTTKLVDGKEVTLSSKEEKELEDSKAQHIIDMKAYNNLAWKRNRLAEYPSIQECVHAILDDDLTALQKKRQTIKTKYPK